MTTKSVVMGISIGEEDFSDVAGTISKDEDLIFIHAGETHISIPVEELMDFIKSELIG